MLLSIGLWFMLFLFLLDCNIPLLAVLHEPREQKKKKDHAGLPVWSVCRGSIFFDITCVYCLDASQQWKLVSCLCALYFRTVAVFVCKSEFATALAFIGSASQACPLQVGSLPVCHLLHACHEVWEEPILCSQLNTSYKCQQTMPWTH